LAGVERFHLNRLLPIGLLCLLATPFLAWRVPELRNLLLAAVGIYAVIVLGTILYVWPINNALLRGAGSGLDAATIRDMVRHWLLADRIRVVLTFAAFLCLLRALSVSGVRPQALRSPAPKA
jgi:uncharacterized membrane protein